MLCRASDEEVADDVAVRRRSSRTAARLRRTSVPLYGRKNNNNNNDDASDDSDSVVSLHRDPLHRSGMLTWRHPWQPAFGGRLPNADRDDNNNGIYSTDTLCCQRYTTERCRHFVVSMLKTCFFCLSKSIISLLYTGTHVFLEDWHHRCQPDLYFQHLEH